MNSTISMKICGVSILVAIIMMALWGCANKVTPLHPTLVSGPLHGTGLLACVDMQEFKHSGPQEEHE